MKVFLVYLLVLALHIDVASGVILSTPGIVRKSQGDTCTFTWNVSDASVTYLIYNQTDGTLATLNPRARAFVDNSIKTISLLITNVRLWDAGNYTLSISNGTTTENDSNALLYVFASSGSIQQTGGKTPLTEGDSVELTCTLTSISQPLNYRPRVTVSWYLSNIGAYIQVLSNGSVAPASGGDIIPRYTVKNDARTLAISSLQFQDMQYCTCYAKEEGSSYQPSTNYYLNFQYKPHISSTNPGNGKFNAIVGEQITLTIVFSSYPGILPMSANWTFKNADGNYIDLPANATVGYYSSPSLSFTLPSTSYYGTYHYELVNSIGSTPVDFQVLAPGRPDPPSALRISSATHYSVTLQWNCMSSNYYLHLQIVCLQLKEVTSGKIAGSFSYPISGSYFNATYTSYFTNLQPDTSYVASINSTNELGSSSIVSLTVRTEKPVRFIVSSDSIQINYPRVLINFRIESGNVSSIYTTYTVEFTGSSYSYSTNVNRSTTQIVINIGSQLNSTEYVFDFTLFNSAGSNLGSRKGFRVNTMTSGGSTSPGNETADHSGNLLSAVIVLAILLGISILVLIGILIAFLINRRRSNNLPPKPTVQETNLGVIHSQNDDDFYEEMNHEAGENRVYTELRK